MAASKENLTSKENYNLASKENFTYKRKIYKRNIYNFF